MTSVLFVLDSPPQSGMSLAFFNSYIELLLESLSSKVELTVFYPEFSDSKELFALNIVQTPHYKLMTTYIPTRYETFSETYINERMDNVFDFILKEEHFDCVHIWSLKNHSFNYPFIAKERRIPVVCSVTDGFLFSNSLFEKGYPSSETPETIRISNFISTSFSFFVKKLALCFRPDNSHSFWFENIGRYSRYYNRSKSEAFTSTIKSERRDLTDDVINFCDRFIFFSQNEYQTFYKEVIPEHKIAVIDAGMLCDGTFENRPFEIEGAVKFGFMGEILPEEGIVELIDAFNLLYSQNYQNELHIYGETHENAQFVNRLKQRVKNTNVFFHGPIQPGRMNAALNTFDALIIPAHWHRGDTFLVNNAIAARKCLVVSAGSVIAEKVKKSGRGLLLHEITAKSIADAVSELERTRKKLYYFMRSTDNQPVPNVEDNASDLLEIYNSLKKDEPTDPSSLMLIRKFNKKRFERQRGQQ